MFAGAAARTCGNIESQTQAFDLVHGTCASAQHYLPFHGSCSEWIELERKGHDMGL